MDCGKKNGVNDKSCLEEFPIEVKNTIENIIKDEEYKNYIINKEPFVSSGSFLGFLYAVDICGQTVNGDKTTSLMIKKSVILEKIVTMSVCDFYSRELFVYEDLSKLFWRLQEDAKVPIRERYFFVKSYKSTTEAIVMENMAKKGFKTYDRRELFPLKFAELSIEKLAKFHALSFVTKERNQEYYESKIRQIKSRYYLDDDWSSLIGRICKLTASFLEGDAKRKIETYAPRLIYLYKKYMQDTVQSQNRCVCHGDYKFQNILVKEVNSEVFDVCPVDYQQIYFGNPVDDFLFFMFVGTDQKFRRQHLKHLKDLYYDSFAKFLSHFDLDVDVTYPREAFEKDYEERFELGLVLGLYLAIYTFARVDNSIDIRKMSLLEIPLVPDEMFGDRVRGIVEDYLEWGYL